MLNKIAIIPARSGSKGLKDKNIIDVCGKPLIAYAIEEAKKSNCFSKIIVSTDSTMYGKIAKGYGAEVMYRGDELSNDKASTYLVIKDVLERLEEQIDYFVLLQPTSPMRTHQHIIEAINIFENKCCKYDFLVSMKEAEHAKILVNAIEKDGSLKNFDTDFSNYKRQYYKDYTPNGAIFIGKVNKYIEHRHFFGEKSIAYVMSKYDSVDIDDELDYNLACLCMKRRLNGEQ